MGGRRGRVGNRSSSPSPLSVAAGLSAIAGSLLIWDISTIAGVALSVGAVLLLRVFLFPYPFPGILGFAPGVFLASSTVRVAATCRFLYPGLLSLPRNFSQLAFCTAPTQVPELIPGLLPSDTQYHLQAGWSRVHALRDVQGSWRFLRIVLIDGPQTLLWFIPGVIYRFLLKSTAWFWWPLAFLEAPPRKANDPSRLQWENRDSLRAKTKGTLAVAFIAIFIGTNVFLTGAMLEPYPFLTPLGYLTHIEWRGVLPWQFLALAISVLTIFIIYATDEVDGWRRMARERGEQLRGAEFFFGLIERLARLRLVLSVALWLIVGGQVLLYFNSQKCWVAIPDNIVEWSQWIYGKKSRAATAPLVPRLLGAALITPDGSAGLAFSPFARRCNQPSSAVWLTHPSCRTLSPDRTPAPPREIRA